MERTRQPLKAAWLLMLATLFWGSSFITQKTLVMVQQQSEPEANTWLLTSLSIMFRFGVAGTILVLWNIRQLRKLTLLELWQGVGLGIFGGLGLLFQMDGVIYTPASTSAFLTQSYCIFIPLWVACKKREWPSGPITISTVMVLVGVAILSQLNFTEMKMGRGEIETLIGSLFFTAQILWLEKPAFARNNPHNFTVVMFLVTALIFLPMPLTDGNLQKLPGIYSTGASLAFSLYLTLACTLLAYTLMNYWQPHLPATQAGLIYCAEPVFTTMFALFVPGIYSAWAGVLYANERITTHQIIGGGLITAANALILFQAARMKPVDMSAPK
jgi:drug/metabolite transporter (DMT)-like permease